MSGQPAPGPARRFLHVCYCCDDVAPVTAFFVEGLAMRETMRTHRERSPGAILGLDGEIEASASFVYDRRGPRVSPAIEIQDWVDPPPVGAPSTDPFEAGVKALGFGVPDLGAATARLSSRGCTSVHVGASPFATTCATLIDPRGVLLELVEEPGLPGDATRLRHLRITCTDLSVSFPFYDRLGFSMIASGTFGDAAFAGVAEPVDARFARLGLPDEPFEVILVQWLDPASHGRHYAEPNHVGLYRAALGVDDTRASYEAMTAAGAHFDRAPMCVALRGTPVPDMWICFISDPDGVPFELVQRPRSAFA